MTGSGSGSEFESLGTELLSLFRRGMGARLSHEAFNSLALRVFRLQCSANRPYGGFVRRRGVDPAAVEQWEDVPFLPTDAFRSLPLVTGDPSSVERVFRTSGTRRGPGARGEHHVRNLSLYRESLIPNFRAHLLPEGGGLPLLCLLAPPESVPDSSLSFMMGEVRSRLCGGEGEFFGDGEVGLLPDAFAAALERAEKGSGPVLLAGTAFSFVHWIEIARREGRVVRLPVGSRIMETGGYKGRSRVLNKEALYKELETVFGVSPAFIVNEYGMTEMLSQFYEPELGRARPPGGRPLQGPPWVRTRILDPLSLESVPRGSIGVLAHFDLANLGSVSAILTEDLGREVEEGFQLVGRSAGAAPRGCSLAMEDFLSSVDGVP